MADRMRRRVAVLVAQEPDTDPRIDWTASLAPTSIEVTVFGIFDRRRSRQAHETRLAASPDRREYEILRARRGKLDPRGGLLFLHRFVHHYDRIAAFRLAMLFLLGFCLFEPIQLLWPLLAASVRLFRIFERATFLPLFRLFSRSISSEVRPNWYLRLRKILRWPLHRAFLARQKESQVQKVALCGSFFEETARVLVASCEADVIANGPFQVFHANDFETLMGALDLKRKYGGKIIYDAHEYWPYADIGASWWEREIWFVIEKTLLRGLDHAFTVTTPLAERMTKDYEFPFASLPNSEPREFTEKPAGVAAASKRSKKTFVFIGGFAKGRGLEFLIRAWKLAAIDDAELILRGPESHVKQHCIQIAKDLGVLDSSVIFAPAVEESVMLESLQNCDVGIIPYEPHGPNHTFCCPNKLSQYMKSGLAILHNDLVFVRQVVDHAQAGWQYDGSNLDAAAQTFRSIANEPAEIECRGANAKRYFESTYNWQLASQELYEHYLEDPIAQSGLLIQKLPTSKKSSTHEQILFIAYFNPNGISTIIENIESWVRLSVFQYDVLNLFDTANTDGLALPETTAINRYDAVIIHSTVAYNAANLRSLDRLIDTKFVDYRGVKVLMKQDEHFRTGETLDYIRTRSVDLVISVARPEDSSFFYPPARIGSGVRFVFGLTGYVSTEMLKLTYPDFSKRAIDIGYRGSIQGWQLGRLGYDKREIGESFRSVCERFGLACDISSRWEDRFSGQAWFDFLGGIRGVLGAESGSSIIDFDGTAETACDRYLKLNPDATFEEIERDVLKPYLRDTEYRTISPRHFEAAATKTVQILYEGHYAGIFKADRHYISLKRDYSNIDEVIAKFRDDGFCRTLVETAYEEIILNPRYQYPYFVDSVDRELKLAFARKSQDAASVIF